MSHSQLPQMFPMSTFNGKLYFTVPAHAIANPSPAPIWSYDGTELKKVATDGFGIARNTILMPGPVYNGYFYVGTGDISDGTGVGQLWRTSTGTSWQKVDTAPSAGEICYPLGVQSGKLLIGFYSYNKVGFAKVFSYDGGSSFEQINEDGFGLGAVDTGNRLSFASVYQGRVHVAVNDGSKGFTPLAYSGQGKAWERTGPDNFGDDSNLEVLMLTSDSDYLYAGTRNATGGQLWRYGGSGWTKLDLGPVSTPENNVVLPNLIDGQLYPTAFDGRSELPAGDAKIYREKTGGGFEAWAEPGFGVPGNNVVVLKQFEDKVIGGTYNLQGFQLWSYQLAGLRTATVSTITSVAPRSGTAGGPAFTLTVKGSGFVSGATVRWNGISCGTTFISDTELRAQIPASFIEEAGTAGVTVINGGPGGGTSNVLAFTVSETPKPTWYLAEGSTAWGFSTFIYIENPNPTALTADITYMPKGSGNITQKVALPAMSQTTANFHMYFVCSLIARNAVPFSTALTVDMAAVMT